MRLDDDTRRRLCRARDALEVIEAGASPRSVHAIARAAGTSTSHFIRVFERAFGATPHQYRIAVRLDRAKRLLAEGDRSVTEVCFDVGFSSLGSFSALFARRFGEPPTVYGRRVRALVQVPGELTHVLAPGCFSLMVQAMAIRDFREA